MSAIYVAFGLTVVQPGVKEISYLQLSPISTVQRFTETCTEISSSARNGRDLPGRNSSLATKSILLRPHCFVGPASI